MVFALCNVLLRNREDAEDATQQCFLSAYRSRLAGTIPEAPAAWLAAIARNECLSRLRRARPESLELRDDDLRDDADVAELVDRRAEIAALSEAIAGLPPAQRQAVVLRDFYGLSYQEIAAALGVSGPAVESLVFRSRKSLQERLVQLRLSAGIAAVPTAVKDALARAVPGFSSGLAPAGAGSIGVGLSAKLLSGQAAAKLAAVLLAAGAGTVALGHEPPKRRPVATTPPARHDSAPAVRTRIDVTQQEEPVRPHPAAGQHAPIVPDSAIEHAQSVSVSSTPDPAAPVPYAHTAIVTSGPAPPAPVADAVVPPTITIVTTDPGDGSPRRDGDGDSGAAPPSGSPSSGGGTSASGTGTGPSATGTTGADSGGSGDTGSGDAGKADSATSGGSPKGSGNGDGSTRGSTPDGSTTQGGGSSPGGPGDGGSDESGPGTGTSTTVASTEQPSFGDGSESAGASSGTIALSGEGSGDSASASGESGSGDSGSGGSGDSSSGSGASDGSGSDGSSGSDGGGDSSGGHGGE